MAKRKIEKTNLKAVAERKQNKSGKSSKSSGSSKSTSTPKSAPAPKSTASSAAPKAEPAKAADSKPKKESSKKKDKKSSQATNNKIAVILFAAAILLFAMTVIESGGVWAALHKTLIGLFGICAFIVPIGLLWFAISLARSKDDKSTIIPKSIGFGIMTAIIGGIIHILSGYANIQGLPNQVKFIWSLREIIKVKNGGALGAIVGGVAAAVAGKTGAILVLLLLGFVFAMIFTGKNLNDLGNLAKKIGGKIKGFINAIKSGEFKKNDSSSTDTGVKKVNFIMPWLASKLPSVFRKKNDNEIYIEELEGRTKRQEAYDEILRNMKTGTVDPYVPETRPREIAQSNSAPIPMPAPVMIEQNANGEIIEKTEYQKPTIECLNASDNSGALNYEQEIRQNAQTLEETLHNFDVNAKLVGICRGPSVTRYELQPAPGVKISKITSLSDDIALAMAAIGVRMEAPIPGKAAVGIEIPNKSRATVSLREIIQTPEYDTQVSKSKLAVAVGKNITGESIICDIAKMPHLLVAGTTGSGKSVCLNSMIISILYNSTPDEVKLLMIDPKQVEFTVYNGISHLLVPVVADPKKAAGALGWAVTEMLKRYKMFSEKNVRDIKGYNRLAVADGEEKMPQIVIFIDELSDLMMAARKEVEDSICRLAQMARAAGMHLVIATQRPSVDVITGVIKGNIPSRIALSVSSQVDSRTIIDQSGAETLLGNGDMLYAPIGVSKPIRVQGCFVSDSEVENVVNFIKAQKDGETTYDDSVNEAIENNAREVGEKKKAAMSADSDDDSEDGGDEMLPKAIEVVVESQMASTTLLQRKLKLGYARAARLMDSLEERGIVGPFEGSKPRKVLISREQWMEMNALGNASPAREKPYGEEDEENY